MLQAVDNKPTKTMNQYSVGDRLFCDFHFGGKPKAKCLAVVVPGTGKESTGRVRVQLTETQGAYKKGEVLEISTVEAVPVKQEKRKRGSFFRWVNTDYAWA